METASKLVHAYQSWKYKYQIAIVTEIVDDNAKDGDKELLTKIHCNNKSWLHVLLFRCIKTDEMIQFSTVKIKILSRDNGYNPETSLYLYGTKVYFLVVFQISIAF